ncbi:MAG: hypothetical protein AAFY99_12925 [Pseudomonadota bacterium]
MEPATLNAMCKAFASGTVGVLVIELETARTRFVVDGSVVTGPLGGAVHDALDTQLSFERTIGGRRYFFKPFVA